MSNRKRKQAISRRYHEVMKLLEEEPKLVWETKTIPSLPHLRGKGDPVLVVGPDEDGLCDKDRLRHPVRGRQWAGGGVVPPPPCFNWRIK